MKHMFFILFIFVRYCIYVILHGLDRVFGRQSQLFVLSYHSIAKDDWRFSVSPEDFMKQMLYLMKHFQFVTLDDLEAFFKGEKRFTRPSVILTIDDGYRDILDIEHFLDTHHITPAIFVLSETNQPNWKELGTKRPFLRTSDIKRLRKKGWVIGSHSATHANLAQLSKKQIRKEITQAKKALEEQLALPITSFAYPRGKYTQEVVDEVENAGFHYAFTMDDGRITYNTDILRIPRIGVDRTHTFAEFIASFSPSVIAFRQLIKRTIIGRYL